MDEPRGFGPVPPSGCSYYPRRGAWRQARLVVLDAHDNASLQVAWDEVVRQLEQDLADRWQLR
eukprot:8406608-Pyramimonas_sp.AAC.1